MSKKKSKKNVIQDFTINDCANAPKPVHSIRKSTVPDPPSDITWDEIPDEFDIIEEISSDGTKNFIYKKRKPKEIPIDDRPGIEYPEIIWYLISKYIKPEDILNFARINKATYSVTKKKAFWLSLYREYCENHPKLPQKLHSDSFKAYGLRQTVIRALYHTYDVFVKRIVRQATQDSQPHLLTNRVCVNVWFCKGVSLWHVYFKLKKPKLYETDVSLDFIEEMGRIDANPEEDTQVLQVSCKSFQEVPPLMGMTLTSVTMTLAQGFRHHKLNLGFTSSRYNTKGIVPECTVILDCVVGALVCDWWHPQYPHSGSLIPRNERFLLKKNFFDDDKDHL